MIFPGAWQEGADEVLQEIPGPRGHEDLPGDEKGASQVRGQTRGVEPLGDAQEKKPRSALRPGTTPTRWMRLPFVESSRVIWQQSWPWR